MQAPQPITEFFKGRFIAGPEQLQERYARIKAYVFDWDGVFNDGYKNDAGSSPFSELDAMGTNLLRFSHHLRTGVNPVFAIISGEKNEAAFALARRECFHAVYFRIKHKAGALEHLAASHGLAAHEVSFVFDDVLDLSASKIAGLRTMVPHLSTSKLVEFCIREGLVDYVPAAPGGRHPVRETCELLMTLGGQYDETVRHRSAFSPRYQEYLAERNAVRTQFFTTDSTNSIQPAQV